jgi:hypothetical protein
MVLRKGWLPFWNGEFHFFVTTLSYANARAFLCLLLSGSCNSELLESGLGGLLVQWRLRTAIFRASEQRLLLAQRKQHRFRRCDEQSVQEFYLLLSLVHFSVLLFFGAAWKFWCITFDHTTRRRRLYRDGQFIGEEQAASTVAFTDDTFDWGRRRTSSSGNADNYQVGAVGDFRLFRKELTALEIQVSPDRVLFLSSRFSQDFTLVLVCLWRATSASVIIRCAFRIRTI